MAKRNIVLSSWVEFDTAFHQGGVLPNPIRALGSSGELVVPGPVYGYRGFGSIDDKGRLVSQWGDGVKWSPGWNESVCQTTDTHEPPVSGCGCGWYGLKTINDSRLHGWTPVARIEYAGVVIEHDDGFRGQMARVDRMVYVCDDAKADTKWKDLAAMYGPTNVYVWDMSKRTYDADAVQAILDQ